MRNRGFLPLMVQNNGPIFPALRHSAGEGAIGSGFFPNIQLETTFLSHVFQSLFLRTPFPSKITGKRPSKRFVEHSGVLVQRTAILLFEKKLGRISPLSCPPQPPAEEKGGPKKTQTLAGVAPVETDPDHADHEKRDGGKKAKRKAQKETKTSTENLDHEVVDSKKRQQLTGEVRRHAKRSPETKAQKRGQVRHPPYL